ncbi:MAG: four helix bundle protein [Patescibacteria group bacterium]
MGKIQENKEYASQNLVMKTETYFFCRTETESRCPFSFAIEIQHYLRYSIINNVTKSNFKNYRFEDLEVWKIGMKIVHEVYQITKRFPKEELFSLVDQLKRAANSIVLNIAEGTGQPTSKGFSVYLNRSKS